VNGALNRHGTCAAGPCSPRIEQPIEEDRMARGLLLWLVGVPIPVIILLWLFFGR
jgi:hypothetical protein